MRGSDLLWMVVGVHKFFRVREVFRICADGHAVRRVLQLAQWTDVFTA